MPLNYAKTALLLLVLTSLFVTLGALIGGTAGMLVAFALALVMNGVSLWTSDTMVLRMYGAQEVDERSAPEYYALVQELAHAADLPPPRVYVIDNAQPNAFATGRSPSKSAVAASTGLLNALSREELAGVIAHELAHIKNRDTLTMTVAATIGGAISMIAQYMQFGLYAGGSRDNQNSHHGLLGALFAILVAPFLAMLIQMAISRSREYQADRMGALICRNPRWLASALEKIHSAAQRIPNWQAEEAPATAHIFIVNPLTGHGVDNLFSTHPNIENRIRALEELAVEMGDTFEVTGADFSQTANRYRETQGPWSSRKSRGPWG